jgi:hypothetical protein
MRDGYTPREGTTAHTIIEWLRKQPAGTAMSGAELDEKLKVNFSSASLKPAIEAGVIDAVKQGRGYVFSLAAPPQPSDGKLTIGSWSDGDVTVEGGTPNEDGSVTYTRQQLQQLVLHVTTPHLASLAPAGAQG